MAFFRGADCDTDHYLMVAVAVAVIKQAAQKTDVQRFKLRKAT